MPTDETVTINGVVYGLIEAPPKAVRAAVKVIDGVPYIRGPVLQDNNAPARRNTPASAELVEARLAVCQGCVASTPDSVSVLERECGACGCLIARHVEHVETICPWGKWPGSAV